MAQAKLKTVGPIIDMEQNTALYASSAKLTASFTLPANCGGVWCYPSLACWWNPIGTAAAAAPSHYVAAKEMFYIPTAKTSTAQIFADSAIVMTVAYMRGSRPAINHAVTRPY